MVESIEGASRGLLIVPSKSQQNVNTVLLKLLVLLSAVTIASPKDGKQKKIMQCAGIRFHLDDAFSNCLPILLSTNLISISNLQLVYQ